MKKILCHRIAALLSGLAMLFTPYLSQAFTPLNDAGSEIVTLKNLAESEAPIWLWATLCAVSVLLIVSVYFMRRLRAANEQLEMMAFMLNRVHEAAYLADADFRILYVNEEACRVSGYSREELLGMTIADIDADFGAEEIASFKAGGGWISCVCFRA
jgi:PAS domain-containing protein